MLSKAFYISLISTLWFCISRSSGINTDSCPVQCSCLGQLVDCSHKCMQSLPPNLPQWVATLDMSANLLSSANVSKQLSQLTEITELTLNNNSLSAIPIGHVLHNLTILKVSHNKLSEMSLAVLKYLPRLRELDVSTNYLTHLAADSFPNSTTLRILNLKANKLTSIEMGSLDAVCKLTELKLAKNLIGQLNKDVFRNLSSLKTLDLSHNRISVVEGLSFMGLKALTILKIKSNQIQRLEDGSFFELKDLMNLHLEFNSISKVTDGWLYGLPSLKQLLLSHNKIHLLDTTWEFCFQLQILDLSYNLLKGIENNNFHRLSNLSILKLDHNQISFVAEGAFNHTPSLVELDMSGNKISWTIEDMQGPFVGLKWLTKLSLANNLITSVSEQALVGLESLLFLDLSGNQIKTIHPNTMNHVPLVHELRINSTSLVCDCGLAWLPLFITNPRVRATDMYCAYPKELNKQLVSTIPYEHFLCSPDDFPKPRLTEEPHTQVALSGSEVVLTCKAISSADVPMSFKWWRNNRDIIEPVLHSENWTTADGRLGVTHISELRLTNVTLEDSAQYHCTVFNDFGTVYSRKANLSVYTFPQLLKTPSNVTTKAGTTVSLECAASGHPSPQISWQKDGGTQFPAAQQRRVHVMPTDDVFFIINVKPVDSGVYSCIAKNIAGVVVANASLTVVEPPSFAKRMENKEVKVGESIVLECMATGSPKPTLRWTKNGSQLPLTERHFFTADDQLLIIMDTGLSDAGVYNCEMSNSFGSSRGEAHLNVIPVCDSSVNEEDMTGVIIITVVCCAVGTSIVWVVIIYQTRKRLNTPTTDTKSEHSKDSGTGDSTKPSHEDLLLDSVSCVHQEADPSPGPEVTLPLLTTFHPHPYKVTCCCDHTNHDRQSGYLCVPVYLPPATTSLSSTHPVEAVCQHH